MARAQTVTLPQPSRSVYKCTVDGKVSYSDEPCLGAQRLEIEPTRGLNKSTGREMTGKDVGREKHREVMAEALKPLSGMDAKELEVFQRRQLLTPQVRVECGSLDAGIARAEADEKVAPMQMRRDVEERLLNLRKRQRDLRC